MADDTTTVAPGSDAHREDVARARAALLDPAVAHIVEMVLEHDPDGAGVGHYQATSPEGRVRFHRVADGTGWQFVVDAVDGRDPLAHQDVDRFTPLTEEQAHASPDRAANAYPRAFEQLAQLFDAPAAPDLVAIHTSAHNWEDQGGHLGEHGSISVVQSRAPFVIAGAGVRAGGMVDAACRLVDLAPTVLALLGAEPCGGVGSNGDRRDDALLRRQDGDVLAEVLAAGEAAPAHVVGVLLDGANANVLYDLAARGEAPNLARLMAAGTTYRFGATSSLPTVTLANHTSILTGAHPGHHGILHNAWWDRAAGEQVITNSPAHWVTAMQRLDPGVETLFDAVHRSFPGSTAISVNEPCDTGADHSIFAAMRAGEPIDRPPPVEELPHTTQRFVRPVKEYRWSSLIDHTAVEQFVGIWSGSFRGRDWPLPRFSWVNFSLTDAAFHEGGPYSEIAAASVADTDARLGALLDAVERAGVLDRTAFFVTADHGMEQSDRSCTGNWAEALDATGVPYRDEGYSFIYVDP
ncbi:MAG: alkaline phosphatase family protein [Acidimicrobiales bacterium]|nr:alkaline phosphatase family protein [Acidimicrobiales bacterium]